MSWASRAARNLLPRSREQDSLAAALREWRYTGDYHDLEAPSADCELCDHPHIRYQFDIGNLHTGEHLLIGSECIHRFGILATDEEGRLLDKAGTRKKVERDRRRLVEDGRKRRAMTAMVALAHKDEEFDIASMVEYLQEREAFTPKQLSLIIWRLRKHQIPHQPGDFKLTIRRGREKEQLLAMKDWELERLTPCLSDAQKTFMAKARSARS